MKINWYSRSINNAIILDMYRKIKYFKDSLPNLHVREYVINFVLHL